MVDGVNGVKGPSRMEVRLTAEIAAAAGIQSQPWPCTKNISQKQ